MWKWLRIRRLIRKLHSKDFRENVYESAADGLARLGAIELLIDALRNSAETKGQAAAATALGKSGDQRAIDPLVRLLSHGNRDVRKSASDALTKLEWNDSVATGRVIKSMEAGDAAACAREGVIALHPLVGGLKDHSYVNHSYGSSSQLMCDVSARALGKIGDRRALSPLLAAIRSNSLNNASFEAVVALRDSRSVKPLVELLSSKDMSTRERAAESLGKMGELAEIREAIRPLISSLRDSQRSVRIAAAQALGRLAAPEAVEGLLTALSDSDDCVRLQAAESLGKLAVPQTVQPLVAALSDPKSDVRLAAARALKTIGWEHADDALAAMGLVERSPSQLVGLSVGVATIAPLIGELKGDHKQAKAAHEILRTHFAAKFSAIPAHCLREILGLEPRLSWNLSAHETCINSTNCNNWEHLDISHLRQLARQELIRRGEKV